MIVELAVASALLMASLTAAQYFRKLVNESSGALDPEHRVVFYATFSERLFPNATAQQQGIEHVLSELRSHSRCDRGHRQRALADDGAAQPDQL